METYKESKARLQELKRKKRRGIPHMLLGAALLGISIEVDFTSGYEWCNQVFQAVGCGLAIYGWVRSMLYNYGEI